MTTLVSPTEIFAVDTVLEYPEKILNFIDLESIPLYKIRCRRASTVSRSSISTEPNEEFRILPEYYIRS